MSVIIFFNEVGETIFKMKNDVYEKLSVEERNKTFKKLHKKGRVVCYCCKGGRELMVSSRTNQDKSKSYYLKRKANTLNHASHCYFSNERSLERTKEDDTSIRFIFEFLLKESMTYAINTKKKKGEKATVEDLFDFISAKLKVLMKEGNNSYQLLNEAYLKNPSFECFRKSVSTLENTYRGFSLNPFIISKVIKMEEDRENYIFQVQTRKDGFLFNYKVPKSDVSKDNILRLKRHLNKEHELWLVGLLTKDAKDNYIYLKKVELFIISDKANIS